MEIIHGKVSKCLKWISTSLYILCYYSKVFGYIYCIEVLYSNITFTLPYLCTLWYAIPTSLFILNDFSLLIVLL